MSEVGPVAPEIYVREADALASRAGDHLGSGARQCLLEAENEARALDDDHVGTEHIVLGVMAADPATADALAGCGITRDLFITQLVGEEGPSPDGPIPYTPRSMMIVGLGLRAAQAEQVDNILPRHLLLGVIAESRGWSRRGYIGPNHLAAAATAAGTDLAAVEAALGSSQPGT